MGNRFDHRKSEVRRVYLALEKRLEAFDRRFGLVEMIEQPHDSGVVVLVYLLKAQRQTLVGQLVPRQHQVMVKGKTLKTLA